jgi:hypothetical protein
MDPTVIAALVGVGGTVVVGVTGYVANVWSTRKTIAHDRESKVWDQRAAVYIEALAALNYRQASRNAVICAACDEARRITHALATSYQQPDWHKLEARMQAFASEPVMTAMQASSNAHMNALAVYKSSDATTSRVLPAVGSEATATQAVKMRQALDTARMAADKADDAIIEQIRAELQGRGKPLGDWQPLSEPDSEV